MGACLGVVNHNPLQTRIVELVPQNSNDHEALQISVVWGGGGVGGIGVLQVAM